VSLAYTLENGATAEMGLGGREGLVDIALFLGGETISNRGIVQIAGSGFSARWTRLDGLVSDWRRVSTVA